MGEINGGKGCDKESTNLCAEKKVVRKRTEPGIGADKGLL